jgi:hypothetical protein
VIIDLSGKRLRVLATTVNSDDIENVELVPHKRKPAMRWAMQTRNTSAYCPLSRCHSC